MPSSFFGKVAALAAVTLSTVSAGPVPRTLELENINLSKFFPALSDNAAIYTPITNKEKFTSLTVRWSNLETPTVNIVVVPGTENDVSEIVSILDGYITVIWWLEADCGTDQICEHLEHPLPGVQQPPWRHHDTGSHGLGY